MTDSSTTSSSENEHRARDDVRAERAREDDMDVVLVHLIEGAVTRSTRRRAARTTSICWTRRVRVSIIRTRRRRRPASTSGGFSPNATQDGFPAPTDDCRRQHHRSALRTTSRAFISWQHSDPGSGAKERVATLQAEIQALQCDGTPDRGAEIRGRVRHGCTSAERSDGDTNPETRVPRHVPRYASGTDRSRRGPRWETSVHGTRSGLPRRSREHQRRAVRGGSTARVHSVRALGIRVRHGSVRDRGGILRTGDPRIRALSRFLRPRL